MKSKTLFLHPLVLFASAWLVVLGLYLLRMSKLLFATDGQVTSAVGLILIPFVLGVSATTLFYWIAPKEIIWKTGLLNDPRNLQDLLVFKRRLKTWFRVWALLSIAEIIASGGLPLIWLFTGSSKVYVDFGIHSLHGLLNSLILALGLSCSALFARYGERRYLILSAGVIFWAVLLVARSLVMIHVLQSAMIILLYRGIPGKLALKIVAVGLIVVIGFGALGDLRSGEVSFRALAQPTDSFPTWLPSGVLWAYIYLTTPMNNLINSMATLHPVNSLLFPNTVALLFPSLIRDLIYSDSQAYSVSGELVDSSFNVSTAYVGPFQDYGSIGMVGFSLLIAFLGAFYWRRENLRDQLIYVVIAQSLLMTVFSDQFFSLPIIAQIGWFYLFFLQEKQARTIKGEICASP